MGGELSNGKDAFMHVPTTVDILCLNGTEANSGKYPQFLLAYR
jgi:hypothetical protein